MERVLVISPLTFFLVCIGCGVSPERQTGSSFDVQANVGGVYDVEALFKDGVTAFGWPQYDEATSSRINADKEYVIDLAGDDAVGAAMNVTVTNSYEFGDGLRSTSRLDDLRIHNQNYQLRIAFHKHDLQSCISRRDVWHANLAIERYGVPKTEIGILNIHIAAWKDGSQVCLGILINGNYGEELYCKASCFNRPTQQEIRDAVTAALVTAGIATSVAAGWIANTAAPAVRPILFAL